MGTPEESFSTPRIAAGALFVNDRDEVLLVHPTYKDTWDIPGGYVERSESPAAACRRELIEELGLDRIPIRLLAVDWAPHEREGDKLLFLFDCGLLGDDEFRIRLDGKELDKWRWIAPAEMHKYLIPRLTRRLSSALRARESDSLYLEHGEIVSAQGGTQGREANS